MWSGLAVALVLPAALVFPATTRAQNGDRIYGHRGTPVVGTISAMSPDEVKVESAAGARTLDAADIKYIVFQDEPNALTSGRTAVLQKNYGQAVADFKKVDITGQRAVVKQDLDFYNALALAKLAMGEGGDKAAAETAMMNFAKSGSGNFHFYESAEILGELSMSSGKYEAASRYFGVIVNKAAKQPDLQLRARLLDGKALEGQKKYDEAIARYKEVADAGNASADAKTMAEVGTASCMAATGKAAEAIKILEGVIEKNDPQDGRLFATTYVALGNAFQKADKPKDALMAYLHVDMLY
jgi:tetratricopeptide (TPR) repeat protein